MEPHKILEGKDSLVGFLKSKGLKEEKDYLDLEYEKGSYFKIGRRRLLAVYELLDVNKIREVRNHFLIEKGLSYCVIIHDGRLIFFRNFGEGRYFLYSERTRDNIAKLDKLRRIDENFDIIFQRKDISGAFYEKFKLKRNFLVRHIKNKIKPVEKYLLAQKIFDRIFFIYFLCHKGIVQFKEGGSISGENLFKILIENGSFVRNLKDLFYRFNTRDNNLLTVGDYKIKIPYLNGGLFRPDPLEPDLILDLKSKDWKGIFDFLNQYHWIIEEDVETAIEDEEKVLTPEILGHVYERSVVEWEKVGFEKEAEEATKEKSARKKKGVYYTPEEVTSYIAENTIYPFILNQFSRKYDDVSDLIEKSDEKELRKLLNILSKINLLDPACGSGAFLIKASEILFHLKVRVLNRLGKKPKYYDIKLDTLTENIYGVDILEGAIEIAKLRLWLWLVSDYIEGSEIQSLPNIEYNLRVGNSLIGWVDEKLEQISIRSPLTDEVKGIFLGLIAYSSNTERRIFEKAKELLATYKLVDYIRAYVLLYRVYRKTHGLKAENLKGILEKVRKAIYVSVNPAFLDFINKKLDPNYSKRKPAKLPTSQERYESLIPFHWRIDFGHIVNKGGFDIIIGNPPYIQKNAFRDFEKNILRKLQPQNSSNMNIAAVFMERSRRLLKEKSYLGMIVPKSLTFSKSWLGDRKRILGDMTNLADVSRAWKEVLLEQVIYIIKNLEKSDEYEGILYRDGWKEPVKIDKKLCRKYGILLSSVNKDELEVANRLTLFTETMGEITRTFSGVPYQSRLQNTGEYEAIGGKEIDRFTVVGVKGYFNEDAFKDFHEKIKDFKCKKILSQRIIAHIQNPIDHIKITSTLDLNGQLTVNTISNTVLTSDEYDLRKLLLLLNSKLISWYAYLFIFNLAIRSMDFYDYYVSKIPVAKKIRKHSFVDSLANYLLFLHQYHHDQYGLKGRKNVSLTDKIEFLDAFMDYLVYEFYLGETLKTNLVSIAKSKLNSISYDEWAKLEFKDELSLKERNRKKRLEQKNLSIISESYERLSKDDRLQKEVEKIKSHKWIQVIERKN